MDSVVIVLGADIYYPLEVPRNCTVGLWKQLLEDGYLGSKIFHAGRLRCRRSNALGTSVEDDCPLPKPPETMFVEGATSILQKLELALRSKLGPPDGVGCWQDGKRSKKIIPETPQPKNNGETISQVSCGHPTSQLQSDAQKSLHRDDDSSLSMFGGYRRVSCIGSGCEGEVVFLAESIIDGSHAAVKFPAKPEEISFMRQLEDKGQSCLGIPRLLASGRYAGAPFLVTELLGPRISVLFEHLLMRRLEERWLPISIVGRMVLRRLEAIHRIGFVHCDISPENILFGRADSRETAPGAGCAGALFLIDFGLARPFPGGGPVSGDIGSAEWSSIYSAEGNERRPEDDLEALGWLLVHGLLGDLPWLHVLGDAYQRWHSATVRQDAITQTQLLKREWLRDMDPEIGACLVPLELYKYLYRCHSVETNFGELPDYGSLEILLGGDEHRDTAAAEAADLLRFQTLVAPLL